MPFKIESNNIGLRNAAVNDVDYIYQLEAHPENSRFVMAYSRERHIQVMESEDEELFVIINKTTNDLLGFVILAGLTNPNLSMEFRRLVIADKGKGLGRQVVNLVVQYCFIILKFHRLWLDVYEDNLKGIHLYQSIGFRQEGKLRDVIKHGNAYRSLLLFSMLEGECTN
jgi:diamine N-acetyltransferase